MPVSFPVRVALRAVSVHFQLGPSAIFEHFQSNSPALSVPFFTGGSGHFSSSFRTVLVPTLCNIRAISEQFPNRFKCQFRAVSAQFQSDFRAVSKQIQVSIRGSFRAVSEQF